MLVKNKLILALSATALVIVLGIAVFAVSDIGLAEIANLFSGSISVNGYLEVNTTEKKYTVSLLDCETMETVSEVVTKGGSFRLSQIPEHGYYTLLVQADGFLPYRINSVRISEQALDKIDLRSFGGDINGDGVIDDADYALLKADYNKKKSSLASPLSDLTADGKVDSEDMAIFLSGKGKTWQDAIFEGERFLDTAKYISPSSIVTTDSHVIVGDETRCAVYKLNPSNGNIVGTYLAGACVNSILEENGKLYVAVGELCGEIVVLDSGNFSVVSTIEVGHTPSDMLLHNQKLYVANRFSETISVIDTANYSVVDSIKVTREPIALAFSNQKLYALHHLTDDSAIEDVVSAKVSVIDIASNSVIKTAEIINGASGAKDIVADQNGRLYISHVLGRYAYPTTQLDRGWINTNAITVFDSTTDSAYATVLLDQTDLGAANPWGVDVVGDTLVVALSGVHEAMVIDLVKLNEKLSSLESAGKLDSAANSLKLLDGARTRVALGGNGARAVAISSDGSKAYFTQYFSGDVAVLSLADNSVSTLSLGEQPENDVVRKGHILWSDATLCYQKWQSCNSCHPDARVDGLNWDNLNDGLGTHKNAKSMLYAHRTPPAMVTGIRENAEIAVKAGMKYIQFNVIPDEDLEAIDEYLKSLLPVASPYLNRNGALSASAQSGKQLFEDSGCITCHPAPLYTDMRLHNNGIIDPENDGWEYRPFDTTTLVEVWRTAPYRFNGKFATIRESVVHDTNGAGLTDEEIDKLTEYVLSIGAEGEAYGIEQVFASSANGKVLYSKLESGATMTGFTVRKQDKYAREATVEVILASSSGQEVARASFDMPAMKFNTGYSIQLPSSFVVPDGGKLTFNIKDTRTGKPVATSLVLENYR